MSLAGQRQLLAHIRQGVGRATKLAALLGVQPGTVSKWAKKLVAAGQIIIKGREYYPSTPGEPANEAPRADTDIMEARQ